MDISLSNNLENILKAKVAEGAFSSMDEDCRVDFSLPYLLEDKNIMGELLMAVKEVTKQIGLKSYKTLINIGKEAGQEVFHLHIHIL